MATPLDFDPLSEWLGIPQSQRPPTHYALLGLTPLETSHDCIQQAYLKCYQAVRRYEVGPRQETAVQLLEELSRAFLVLSNPDRKQEYDQTLNNSGKHSAAEQFPPDRVAETVETTCPNPNCRATFLLQPQWAGSQASCKTCGAEFAIGDDLEPLLLSSTDSAVVSDATIVETSCPNPQCRVPFLLRRDWVGARANCKTCGVEFVIGDDFALVLPADSEPSSRAERAWDDFDEIRLLEELAKLREDLRRIVLDGGHTAVPDLRLLRDCRNEHDRLAGEVMDLQELADQLNAQHEQFIETLGRLAHHSDAESHQRRKLDETCERLGHAAYQAFVAGALPDQPLLVERKVCGFRLARLQEDQKRLDSSVWLSQKAKGQALRAINRGELQRERSLARSLETKFGRELIETDMLGSVLCPHTERIIAEVRQIKTNVARETRAVAGLRAQLEANNHVVPPSLELAKVLSVNRFETQLSEYKRQIQAKRLQLTTLRSSLPDLLLESLTGADLPADGDLSRLFRDLQNVQAALQRKGD